MTAASAPRIGLKLATEDLGPAEIVELAVLAEDAGLDFVELSDHYHPWLSTQHHSPNTWVTLGAIAARTTHLGLVTGVTCPSFRYHPAIVAHMAATLQLISDGRFTLGVGSGERLNEHITGEPFPAVDKRHEALREALQIIRMLWKGGYQSFDGRYLQLEDARVFDLPETLPPICVAASGGQSLAVATDLGDGLFAVEPDADLVSGFRSAGGTGPIYGEVSMAWGPDADAAAAAAAKTATFGLLGWKVMAELPNPVNFDAAVAHLGEDDIRAQMPVGPDPEPHVEAARAYLDAGFDNLVLNCTGGDVRGFIRFAAEDLIPRLR
jgi:G6PDH family F420-dependent oxidoreductase